LGIDVGGTFSDSVLMDLDRKRLLSKAKSPTTHGDLIEGIKQSVGLLDRNLFQQIRLVSLSTTLATNALVEGRRSRIDAILPGYKRSQCPEAFLPDIHIVGGGHTAEGNENAFLDTDAVDRIIRSSRDTVEAYAVSSYFSTRNPVHELQIREMIRQLAPDIPVVCGCDLSHKLNAKTRATTTILNAHLIPIIRDLIHSVKKALSDYCIDAPLMVVKGDGSVFRDAVCLDKPVETILSGPAASVVGAGFLMQRMDRLPEKAVVMDIGGTTSDIAVLQNGYPRLNASGVTVGRWQTHVAAVDVRTVGLGGDSHIRIDQKKEMRIGPKRVEPLCLLARRFPGLVSRLKVELAKPVRDPRFSPTDFWVATNKRTTGHLTAKQKAILDALAPEPLNIYRISDLIDAYPITLRDELIGMEDQSLIGKSGFTPTDIFHINNFYSPGVRKCSLMAAEFLAAHIKTDVDTLIRKVWEIYNRKAGLEVIEALSSHPVAYADSAGSCPAGREIWRNGYWERGKDEKTEKIGSFQVRLSLDTPIVGVGAPSYILVPHLANRMGTRELIPEHAGVTNAIGAVVGTVLIQEQVLIRPSVPKGFACFASAGRSTHGTIEAAIENAGRFLEDYIRDAAKRSGGNSVEVKIWEDRKQAVLASGDSVIIEVIVHGEAVAKPKFQERTGAN